METIVNSDTFMKLYNQIHKINPESSAVTPNVVQDVATSPVPVFSSYGSNGNLGKIILIAGLVGLVFYGGYKWHKYNQEKKYKQV